MTPQEAYTWLTQHSVSIRHLTDVSSLAGWDQATYLPKQGHGYRAEVLGTMATLAHGMQTDPRIGEALATLEGSGYTQDPLSIEAVNIRQWRLDYVKHNKIPERLVSALAVATSKGQSVWEQARPANDWASFAPVLKEIFALSGELADALGYQDERYDALLGEYEIGSTTRQLEGVFAHIRAGTVQLLEDIKATGRTLDTSVLHGHFPAEQQRKLSMTALQTLGFDLTAGRLDEVAHPFMTDLGPHDVRLTTRFHEDFFNAGFFGTLHEMGHGHYGQGLPKDSYGTPFAKDVSLGIHESQSRSWENLVGRSRAFWHTFWPQVAPMFKSFEHVSLDQFYAAINAVQPSLIRIEADELTYNLHIMVRFELELALLRGDLSVDELPLAWDDKYQAYLGIRPDSLANGVMQDVHWSAGLIGYFPTYTLGNMYASQLFAKAQQELPLHEQFAQGNFAEFLQWSRRNVHQHGSRYWPRQLIQHVTGHDLDATPMLEYMRQKFSALYGF